jgi:hypothetical protein
MARIGSGGSRFSFCSLNKIAGLTQKIWVSRDDATAQRKAKKRKSMTENEIAKHIMDAALLILLKHGSKRVVNGL